MLIHNLLEISAQKHPEKTAIIHDDRRVNYRETNAQANSIASHLHQAGIKKGDRIALLFENNIDYILSYFAISKIGGVASPLNPGLKPNGLKYLLNDLKPVAIITNFKSERILKAVNLYDLPLHLIIIRNPRQKWGSSKLNVLSMEDILSESEFSSVQNKSDSGQLANIIYTSGSTGKPKGVMLSHKNIVSNTIAICNYLKITHDDIQMVVLPFFYVMGKSLLNTHIAAGGTIVLNNRFLYPADVVNQMITEKVTSFSGVPSTYAYLLNRSPLAISREKLYHLRYCSQAGGHMAKSVKLALKEALPNHTQIVIMYGATEAAARLTYLEPSNFEDKIDSIGKPIENVSIRIIDNAHKEVEVGCLGELVATGPNIMIGYWKSPIDTQRVLSDQGYHTGDIGYKDEEGFLFIKQRKDTLLKVGGHRINPTEIEDFLIATDLIIETAVVGVPDQILGTKLIAIVVPKKDSLDTKTLMEICAKELPIHKLPKNIFFLRTLPKNANGKIDLKKCKKVVMQKINQL